MRKPWQRERRGLNRDEIKLLAIGAMLLNHCAHIFLEPGRIETEILVDLGYFTAITMCYFLVEGIAYTRSKARYAGRLALFAVLSELPFCLAFSQGEVLTFCGMNMIFTLLLCFGILMVWDQVEDKLLRVVLILWLVLISQYSDWGWLAPAFTLMFAWARGSEHKKRLAFLGAVLLFGGYKLGSRIGMIPIEQNLLLTLGNMTGPSLAAVLLCFGYHGRRMARGRKAAQWFFYGFYPLHLLVLGLLRLRAPGL